MRRLGMSAASAAIVLAAQCAVAQSLTSVPDNASVMIKINNLEGTNKKIGALAQACGVAGLQPALADPLAYLKGLANVDKGLNTAGEAAMIIVNREGPGEGEPFIYVIPVSDYNAFLGNFEGATTENGITSITLPQTDETLYVTSWGSFAAASPDRDLVANKPQATKMTGLAAKEMASKDVVLYVNFPAFRTMANQGLNQGQAMIGMMVDPNSPNAAVKKAGFGQMFKGFGHVVNETQAITVGASLSNDGVQLTYLAEFAPTSYLGTLVKGWKVGTPQLAGIPEGKYAMVSAINLDGATLNKLVDDMTAPILAEVKNPDPQTKELVDSITAIKQLLTATQGGTFGLSAGQGQPGKSPLFDVVSVTHGDAKTIMASMEKASTAGDEFQQLFQMPGMPQRPSSEMVVTKNAKTVGGVSFDRMTQTLPETADPQQQAMARMMFGADAMETYNGIVNEKLVLGTTYKEDAKLQSAIDAAKTNKPLILSPQAKTAAGKLPQQGSFMVAYLYPDQIMAVASRASEAATGNKLPTQLPANGAPMVMSASVEGSAVRGDVFVPTSLLQAATQAAMQQMIQQQQQQHQQDPGAL